MRQSKASCRGWTIRLRLVKRHSRRGSIFENLRRHGACATWTRDTIRSLSAGKNYLKSVYKSHLGLEEPCADHCTVFSLSDPVEDKFSGECCHDHNQTCSECADVLKTIEDTLRNGDLDLSVKQKERARWAHLRVESK